MIIFGAAIVGEATFHAIQAKGEFVTYFLDNRIEGELLGVPIIKMDNLKSISKNARFVLTSPNISDMITPLERLGFRNWVSCGDFLRDFDISGIEFNSINGSNKQSRYTPEHVKYLIRTCLHHHDNYMTPSLLTVQSVDLIVTEKCSMKCRDCSNLMQYYESPQNADLEQTLGSIDDLCARMDEVYEVRVIGGEPFVNKEVHLIIEKLTAQSKIKKVSVFTNATIVPREHQWAALQHPKVRLFITDYDELSRNIRPLVAALEARGIAFVSEKANGWTDCASLTKHNRTPEQNAALFDQCCAKNLATLADGRLYRCPFSANAAKLSAVPDYRQDYLDVATAAKIEVRDFLRNKPYIEACDHCNGRSYGDTVITPAIQTKAPLKYQKYQVTNGVKP